MNTLTILGAIYGFWLTATLPYTVYPGYFSDFFNLKKSLLRMRDGFGLMFIPTTAAIAISYSIMKDIYGEIQIPVIDSEKQTVLMALIVVIWLPLIWTYYFLVMRKRRIKKIPNDIVKDREVIINKINKSNKVININLIITPVVFVFLSIGEGFFQDLLYHPFLKPFLCNTFEILC